ncbi:TolC family outer membrane protein [Inhella gelatinilytica]|uniref:TolC family outer membrane protein n=1 Tax=Inhella gelatinilytica TaxID=2795030 RepID=A0A931IYH2_9BURK|nr:TolC family outer membrane protein [Inhella gelatinilytica]MBH9553320.1 TolC family outer membrane protein [Inhella gelatinilytica]
MAGSLRKTVLALSLACLGAGATAEVLGFARAFDAAVSHDAQFEAARHERNSAHHGVGVARAGLLPTLSWSSNRMRTQGERDFSNALNQPVTVTVDYIAPQNALQLRAPLFNADAITRYKQAMRQADAADALYRVRGNELLDRLAVAYLQRLLAEEALTQAQAQQRWIEEQVSRAEQRLQRGEGSRIELADARAQHALVQARVSEARDQVRVARAGLVRLTGTEVDEVPKVSASWQLMPLDPTDLSEWQSHALRFHAAIQAREKNVEVARMGVERQQAGYYPRLDLVASAQTSSNESVSNLNQSNRLRSYGLQLSVPIYNGGGVHAGVQAAQSDLLKVQAELEAERRTAQVEVERQYWAALNGRERVGLYQDAVRAAELMVEGVQRGLQAGVRTTADVLEAQSRLFNARKELLQAQLDGVLARARLQLLSGTVPAEVAQEVERWLGMAGAPVEAAAAQEKDKP